MAHARGAAQWRAHHRRYGGPVTVASSRRSPGRKWGGTGQGGEDWRLTVRWGNGEQAETTVGDGVSSSVDSSGGR
jgi:hypothetical protein